jgi:ABC-type nitrate/sulfonate/bicarbonate transport system permease component
MFATMILVAISGLLMSLALRRAEEYFLSYRL